MTKLGGVQTWRSGLWLPTLPSLYCPTDHTTRLQGPPENVNCERSENDTYNVKSCENRLVNIVTQDPGRGRLKEQ